MTRLHIIGIGNSFRGDDSVGARVVERLQQRVTGAATPGVRFTQSRGDVAELIQAFEDCQEAVLIDAVYCTDSVKPGAVIKMDLHSNEVPLEHLRASSHCLGVAESVELARVLDCLPATLTLWGIAGENFPLGSELSAPVAVAADAVVETLWGQYFAPDTRANAAAPAY